MKKICLLFCLYFGVYLSKAQHNTILIIADDLSPDYFGFYEDHVDTVDVPNIRKLLNKGVRFKNAMSNPVCSSTRTTILTGRYSFRTGVGGIIGGVGSTSPVDTSEMTIPKLLKLYNTSIVKANIGKWHISQPMPTSNLLNPLRMGYDHFEGPFIGQLPSFTNWTKYTNGISSTVTTYATTENVNNAITWLKAQNTVNPFFLWIAFNAPHEPLHLPPAGLHSFTTLTGTTQDINANPKSYFKAMIQAMDHEIGRLFDSLTVMNKLDSTDIIFIGDNGNTPRTAQISDLTKAKGTVYQYGVHVPMIIAGPSVASPGRVSDALVNTVDLFATILELMGDNNWITYIPANKPVDTKSLLPVLKNQSTSIRPWSFAEIFKLTTDSSDGKAIRNEGYKLIKFDYGQEELYHLAVDSLEANNLLNGTLSAIDLTNYNYLCNEMTNLVGSGSYCSTSVGSGSTKDETYKLNVFPNPFRDHVYTPSLFSKQDVTMYDALGNIMYKGNSIETQNFSDLVKGLYIVHISGCVNCLYKVIKE